MTPDKPPMTYEERRAAEEKARAERNADTQRAYRLTSSDPSKRRSPTPTPPKRDPVPGSGQPTRDMAPVVLKLRKRQPPKYAPGEGAEVISIHTKRSTDEENK